MPYLVVSPRRRLDAIVAEHDPSDVLGLASREEDLPGPEALSGRRRLDLVVNDIPAARAGYILAGPEHIRPLIAFARSWPRTRPLAVHCFAGISRSTASAFIIQCALSPEMAEAEIAARLRAAAPSATPNPRFVAVADDLLGRKGRMSAAIAAIGRGAEAGEGQPFILPLAWPRLALDGGLASE